MTANDLKKNIKSHLILGAFHLGVFDLLRRLQHNHVTILMYHRFSLEPEPFKLSCKVFERQLQYLVQRYNVISFNDYLEAHNDKKIKLPDNSLLITIDDGYQDCFDYAFPLLNKFNIPATVFLATNFISNRDWLWSNKLEYILKNSVRPNFEFLLGTRNHSFDVESFAGWHHAQLAIFEYCRSLKNAEKDLLLNQLANDLAVSVPSHVTEEFAPLTWEQIIKMHSHGITFGSHSSTHPIFSRLSDGEAGSELADSKRAIEQKISSPVNVFCYPNGQLDDFSDATIRILRECGYRAAVTTVCGSNRPDGLDLFRLKRKSISSEDAVVLSRSLTRRHLCL